MSNAVQCLYRELRTSLEAEETKRGQTERDEGQQEEGVFAGKTGGDCKKKKIIPIIK